MRMAYICARKSIYVYLLQGPVPLKRLHLLSFTSGSFDAGPLQGHGRRRCWKIALADLESLSVCMQDTAEGHYLLSCELLVKRTKQLSGGLSLG